MKNRKKTFKLLKKKTILTLRGTIRPPSNSELSTKRQNFVYGKYTCTSSDYRQYVSKMIWQHPGW